MQSLTLVSHALCPYAQRAAIALRVKQVPFRQRTVDLAAKPDWFLKLSPLGKVPLLLVNGETVLFESNVILEFLEETEGNPLHPADPLRRANHRSWIEFGSAILNAIARFYSAREADEFQAETARLAALFDRVESALEEGPWFCGKHFSLVDAVYGPIFRYFDTFDRISDFGILDKKPKTAAWRAKLGSHPAVREAVGADYNRALTEFVLGRAGILGGLMAGQVDNAT